MGIAKEDTSGITPFALVAVCAGIGAAFILSLAVAFVCKAVNRPTVEAMPYLINGRGALYQPSAAGYGARPGDGAVKGAGGGGGLGPSGMNRTPSMNSQSRSNLLDHAQPMGRDDVSFMNSPSSRDLSRTHTRGTSSSISKHPFPSAPSTVRRPGMGGGGGGHPPLPGQNIGPDGSGFTPGQPVFRLPGASNGSTDNFGVGASTPAFLNSKPSMSMDAPRSNRDLNRMSMVSMARGPPPATAESRRRSRYSRIGGPDGTMAGPSGSGGAGGGGGERSAAGTNRRSQRIDSVGPGVLRKSMFLTGDAQFPGLEALQRSASNYANGLPPSPAIDAAVLHGLGGGGAGDSSARGGAQTAPTLRRVESVNRGDPRRRSNYITNGRPLEGGGGGGGGGASSLHSQAPMPAAPRTSMSSQRPTFDIVASPRSEQPPLPMLQTNLGGGGGGGYSSSKSLSPSRISPVGDHLHQGGGSYFPMSGSPPAMSPTSPPAASGSPSGPSSHPNSAFRSRAAPSSHAPSPPRQQGAQPPLQARSQAQPAGPGGSSWQLPPLSYGGGGSTAFEAGGMSAGAGAGARSNGSAYPPSGAGGNGWDITPGPVGGSGRGGSSGGGGGGGGGGYGAPSSMGMYGRPLMTASNGGGAMYAQH